MGTFFTMSTPATNTAAAPMMGAPIMGAPTMGAPISMPPTMGAPISMPPTMGAMPMGATMQAPIVSGSQAPMPMGAPTMGGTISMPIGGTPIGMPMGMPMGMPSFGAPAEQAPELPGDKLSLAECNQFGVPMGAVWGRVGEAPMDEP